MKLFPVAHAGAAQWEAAATSVLAQLQTQLAGMPAAEVPALALVYITDHYAAAAQQVLDFLRAGLPDVRDWSGTVGVGVAAQDREYFDEPALAVMLLDVPASQYRVFSGVSPLPARAGSAALEPDAVSFVAHSALVHADGATLDLAGLLSEMSERTTTGYLFGGLSASRTVSVQFALSEPSHAPVPRAAGGVFSGGLSGVAFSEAVPLISRVTQGCQPVGPLQVITKAHENVVLELDGKPALDVLLQTLDVSLEADPQQAISRVRATLAGLVQPEDGQTGRLRTGHFGTDTRVRHIVGLDGARKGVALADHVQTGMRLAFCQRHAAAARADLVRICSEIREELAPPEWELMAPAVPAGGLSAEGGGATVPATGPSAGRRICGAVYVSCSGRGGPHFGGPNAELQIVRHALGDVPLVGFFAGGEIAHHHLYGYTGVLTVWVADEVPQD